MSTYRCSYCDAPLTYTDGKTRVPHTSWCPRAPYDPPERRPLVADDHIPGEDTSESAQPSP